MTCVTFHLQAADKGESLSAVCLQGLVNRTAPRLLLRWNDHDDRWFRWFEREYDLQRTIVGDLTQLVALFRDDLAGLVLWDPQQPHTRNLATLYAAFEQLLPVTAVQAEQLRPIGLTVLEDLSQRFKGSSSAEMHRFAMDRWLEQCDRTYAACLAVEPAASPDDGRNYLLKFQDVMRDAVVSRRMFCFDLTCNPQLPDEAAVRQELMRHYRGAGYLLGWHTTRESEAEHLSHAARHGLPVACSAYIPNLSFWQHLPPRMTRQPDPPPCPELDPDKVYLSFILSDGDALWCMHQGQGGLYDDAARGTVPVGWGVQTLLADLAPAMLSYYFETATPNDCFVASASGLGYSYSEQMPPELLEAHAARSARVFEQLNLRVMQCYTLPRHCGGKGMHEAGIETYRRHMAGQIVGVQEGYWADQPPLDRLFDDFAWGYTRLPDASRWGHVTTEHLWSDLGEMIAAGPRPMFIPIHPYEPQRLTLSDIAAKLKSLGHKVQVVRPDHLFLLMQRYRTAQRCATPPLAIGSGV